MRMVNTSSLFSWRLSMLKILLIVLCLFHPSEINTNIPHDVMWADADQYGLIVEC